MTLILSTAQDAVSVAVSSLSDQNSVSLAPLVEEYEFTLQDPQQRSRGYRRHYFLPSGLGLLIEEYTLYEDLMIEYGAGDGRSLFEISFNLLGNNKTEGLQGGQSFVQTSIDECAKGFSHWNCNQRILKIDLHLSPRLLQHLSAGYWQDLPPAIQKFIETNGTNGLDYLQIGTITPAMQQVLQQIWQCPYHGLTRQLFLEGKCLELMALRLEALDRDSVHPFDQTTLKGDDVDRIHQAKDILLARIDSPPTLLELSRQVGLNDRKLKQGFRQIFGMTVFGYLHDYRMKQAQQLLTRHDIKIEQVAEMVGYTNRSRFAAAFRRKFGVNPKTYQLQQR